jgi:hypothetical protein
VAVDLVSYRDDLEDMTAEALTEYYNHSAGLKPTMEMTRVYDHYAHLTSLESALELAAMGAPTELQRFAAEAYVGDGTKQLTDRAANLEASLTVPFDGRQVPYRQVRPLLLNEPDAARRRELYRSRCEVTERDLNPVLAELAQPSWARPRCCRCTNGSGSTRPAWPRVPMRSWRTRSRGTSTSSTASCAAGWACHSTRPARPTCRG